MKNIKYYNIYIFISTFTRNIIDIYSVIFLYQNNISIKSIVGIYTLIYFLGAIISTISIKLGNIIGYKYIFLISSITTGLSFYIINNTKNLYLISIILSISIFTYHPIKHYYGLNILNKEKKVGYNLIFVYLATLLSSYFTFKKINILYLIIISIIGIIPTLLIQKNSKEKICKDIKINKKKIRFFILDQFKIIFLLLEPLYLYLLSKELIYVSLFNIIITISSIICIYILTNKINLSIYYKYINILFTIILLLKLNIINKNILLFLAILEGIGIKTNELVSTINLYNNKKNNISYLIISEIIFCLTRSLILSIIYLLDINLKTSLYILLIGIFLLSFQYKKDII